MQPTGNIKQPYCQQPPPLKLSDRIALLFMYAVGTSIAYNAFPRVINKPAALMIFGAGLWHVCGCSSKCLQEVARYFFGASSHEGGPYSTHTHTTVLLPSVRSYGSYSESSPSSPSLYSNVGGWDSYSSSFSTMRRTSTNSTMPYSAAPARKNRN